MQGDPVYENKITKELNSVTLDAQEAIGYNLKNHLETNTTILNSITTVSTTYTFKGWSFTSVV